MSSKSGNIRGNQGIAFCLKLSGKNKVVLLILEAIRETSGKLLVSDSSMVQYSNMLK